MDLSPAETCMTDSLPVWDSNKRTLIDIPREPPFQDEYTFERRRFILTTFNEEFATDIIVPWS
jgi:hypothetical protein